MPIKIMAWAFSLIIVIAVLGFALITFLFGIETRNQYAIVVTNSGPVRGKVAYTLFDEKSYYAFQGIPYAAPPIKGLRFRPPEPVQPWEHTLNCIDVGNICPQGGYNGTAVGSEDCLIMNIYTPHLTSAMPHSVMVYIHGGAWYSGYGVILRPDFLINEDVIVITINYRLGALGFMSLGTPEYSGLQGLKDQQMALTWINENIDRFGGDKTKVTIFGDSSGTVSSMFHMLAPESRGLFQRSIEISFTFDIWSIFKKSHHLDDMFEFAKKSNSSVKTYDELVDFLINVDKEQLVHGFPFEFYKNIIMPSLENSNALHPLVDVTPKQLMLEENFTSGIDVMTGFTTAEAYFLLKTTKPETSLENLRIQLPSIHFNFEYDTPAYRAAAKRITKHYLSNASERIDIRWERLKSDVYQRYFIDMRIKLLAAKSMGKTFYYRFGADTTLNLFKQVLDGPYHPGASHGDDICYIGPCNYTTGSLDLYNNVNSVEYKLIKSMAGLYANFAKFGNPLPGDGRANLQRVRPGNYPFVDITNNGLHVGEEPFKEQSQFWDELIADYPTLFTWYN